MIYGPDGKCLMTLEQQEDDSCESLAHLWVLYIFLSIGTVTLGVSILCWLGLKLPTHY